MVARNTHIKGLKKKYDQTNIQSKNNINKQINKKTDRETDRQIAAESTWQSAQS